MESDLQQAHYLRRRFKKFGTHGFLHYREHKSDASATAHGIDADTLEYPNG
jgi:hypothetical protein